jgi:hypothetical protein
MSVASTSLPPLRIALGSAQSAALDPGLPLIAGSTREHLFGDAQPVAQQGDLQVFRDEHWVVGAASVRLEPNLETATLGLYRSILAACPGHRLARIWNYVPAINAPGPDGLENYRAFCRGRSVAFEQHLGPEFKTQLPAASAVGSRSDRLTVIFAASRGPTRHVENPLQVPAYDYPPDYGPRAPSFARATLVGDDRPTAVFVSGTSAVRGHATIAPESTPEQLACTLENLRELSLVCGLGADLGADRGYRRHFKVYLRHVEDQAESEAVLTRSLLRPDDEVSYVQSDICRAALNIEIEASLLA